MDRKSDKSVNLLNSLSSMGSSTRITSNAMVPNQKIRVQNQSSHPRITSSHSGQPSSQSSSHSSHLSHSSQVVYTPRLKKVLKSYQASATTSLNGPDWPHRVSSVPSSPSSSSSSVSSPLSSVPSNRATPPMPPNSLSGFDSKVMTKSSNSMLPKTSDSTSRLAMDSNRFSEMSLRSSLTLNRSKTIGKDNIKDGLKCDSYDPFLAPPPFPIQQPPLFTPPDQNRCERSETILEGETISCFTVGGEKRLCLPQILTTVLRDFSLPQINSVCDELQIFCSRCTIDQLEVLKMTSVIPASAPSCGLITKTDAERLCAALLYSNPPKAAFSLNAINGKQMFTFKVYHQCFGKCVGLYVPALYVQPFSTCIECLECHGLFAPQKFVCHSHHSRENRTCHWGFDSSNWRAYLLVAKDKHRISSKTESVDTNIEEHLNEMKARFDFKRKIADSRDESPICDPSKRLKYEEPSPSSIYPSYPSYMFSPYGWADPSLLMYWYPALASGGSNSSLSARLSAFKPWPANALGNGKHLPPNLMQCMPQGLDRCFRSNKCRDSSPLEKSEKIGNKSLNRCTVEPSIGSAPLKTFDSSIAFNAQKPLKSSDTERPSKDKTLYDDDSFSSNPTLGSENSSFSDEENTSLKNKSEKIFANLELILEENNLSKELKVKIISEVQNIINKLSSIESKRPTPPIIHTTHKKKILNEIQDKKIKESSEMTSTDGKLCGDVKSSMASSLGQGVSSCSPPLIKREPNSPPLMADPKLNCVH